MVGSGLAVQFAIEGMAVGGVCHQSGPVGSGAFGRDEACACVGSGICADTEES